MDLSGDDGNDSAYFNNCIGGGASSILSSGTRDIPNISFGRNEDGGRLIDITQRDTTVTGVGGGFMLELPALYRLLGVPTAAFGGVSSQTSESVRNSDRIERGGQGTLFIQPNGNDQFVAAGAGNPSETFRYDFDELSGVLGLTSVMPVYGVPDRLGVAITSSVFLGVSDRDSNTQIGADFSDIGFFNLRQDQVSTTRLSAGGELLMNVFLPPGAIFGVGPKMTAHIGGGVIINNDDVDVFSSYTQNAGGAATVTGMDKVNEQTTTRQVRAGATVQLARGIDFMVEGFAGIDEQWINENVPGVGAQAIVEDVDFSGVRFAINIDLGLFIDDVGAGAQRVCPDGQVYDARYGGCVLPTARPRGDNTTRTRPRVPPPPPPPPPPPAQDALIPPTCPEGQVYDFRYGCVNDQRSRAGNPARAAIDEFVFESGFESGDTSAWRE